MLKYTLEKTGIKNCSYSLLRFLLKKLAHSEQVFLLPTQKTGDMPTINVSKYFIRNKNISGLASTFAQKITKFNTFNKCKKENILAIFFFQMQKTDYVKERPSPYGCCSLLRLVLQTNVRRVESSQTWLMSTAEYTEISQKGIFFF